MDGGRSLPESAVRYFAVIGVPDEATLPEAGDGLPVQVLQRYPQKDHKDVRFPPALASFCFPRGGAQVAMPEDEMAETLHGFVLTNEAGDRCFGAALHIWCFHSSGACLLQRALAVVSTQPLWGAFRAFLYSLRYSGNSPERFVVSFVSETPLPPPGFQVIVPWPEIPAFALQRPAPNQLPLLDLPVRWHGKGPKAFVSVTFPPFAKLLDFWIPVPVTGAEVSESSFDSGTSFQSDKSKPKMGVLYWGGGLEGQGWDLSGRARGGFPRIDRYSDALVDSWKGRMENAQVTLRMCASEGPGFKRYMKHFMMLSSQACVEFRLKQYHRYNTVNRRKVLTERQVIGGILDCWNRTTANSGNSGMRISNGGPGEPSFIAFLRRRARRYRAQAHKLGGHFAAVILEGGQEELKFVAAARTLSAERKSSIKRVLLILGGPDGIPGGIRQEMRLALEEYTDFPLLGLALPGGILHSYYALATVLVFHDQGLLIPYLEFHVGKPRQVVKPKARPPTRQGEIHEMPRSANSEDPTIPKVPEPSEPSEPREAPPRPPTNITNITNITNLTNGLGACTPKPKPPSCPPPAHLLAQRPRLPDQPPERVFDGPFFAGMSALCAFGEILVGLIWPLRPAAVYVPLLPDALVDFCGAPLPFVLGISSEMVQRAEAICEPQTMFVDIDHGEIRAIQENCMSTTLGFCSTRPVLVSDS
ncbi:unnamed protein product [Symbiodinium natans]|uniref:uDENN domain-containing protein n=1 Tax=Symbiodinium natans TaxID=878477 RepID=A0A812SBI0_9DINO|nr:unnamed protein product [Symbiodinium natans]